MRAYQVFLLAGLTVVSACSETRGPATLAEESEVQMVGAGPDERRAPMERLARRVALAMRDPEFRAYVRGALEHSPFRERKLPFSRFVSADHDRAGAALARADGNDRRAVGADLEGAGALEFYMPVADHRARWDGGEEVLVATAIADHERPVAYDLHGRRVLLDADRPPVTPVLAVVPAEMDFDRAEGVTALPCGQECPTDPGTPPNPPPPQPPTGVSAIPPLRMTYFSVNKDFEGWLKGDPEYEIHVMGPVSAQDTTKYRTLYCIGEHGDKYWDTDASSWNGDVILMTGQEMEAFHAAFPLNNVSILAIEDDDTACEIKVDQDRFTAMVQAGERLYGDYKGARDSTGTFGKTLVAAKSGYDFLKAVANFFKTNDDTIGIAYANTVTGMFHTTANWAWIGDSGNRYGWVRLEMR